MTSFDAGSVVLVRFPFTDLSSTKQRPAVVISPPQFVKRNGDFVMVPLTSQAQHIASLTLTGWKAAGLLKPTWVKPMVATVSARLIVKRLGAISRADREAVRAALRQCVVKEMWPSP
jgi:mRNA interferase MazF